MEHMEKQSVLIFTILYNKSFAHRETRRQERFLGKVSPHLSKEIGGKTGRVI